MYLGTQFEVIHHGGEGLVSGCEAAGHIASRQEQRDECQHSALSLPSTVQNPSPENGVIHIQGGSSHLNEPSLETPLQLQPDFHAGSKSPEFGSEGELSQLHPV